MHRQCKYIAERHLIAALCSSCTLAEKNCVCGDDIMIYLFASFIFRRGVIMMSQQKPVMQCILAKGFTKGAQETCARLLLATDNFRNEKENK